VTHVPAASLSPPVPNPHASVLAASTLTRRSGDQINPSRPRFGKRGESKNPPVLRKKKKEREGSSLPTTAESSAENTGAQGRARTSAILLSAQRSKNRDSRRHHLGDRPATSPLRGGTPASAKTKPASTFHPANRRHFDSDSQTLQTQPRQPRKAKPPPPSSAATISISAARTSRGHQPSQNYGRYPFPARRYLL